MTSVKPFICNPELKIIVILIELQVPSINRRGRLIRAKQTLFFYLSGDRALDRILGRREDGTPIRLGPFQDALSATRARIGLIDLCSSADKSVSVAWAAASTEAERNAIGSAHKEAVASIMRYVEAQIGRARKGKAGRGGYDSGSLAWISFDHCTSRPTVEIAREDPDTGELYTELVTLKVAGGPAAPYALCVPAAVLAEGRVVSPDLRQLKGRVHELGRLYQAFLATNLRRLGVDVVLDAKTGVARVTAIPERVRDAFSKRTINGTAAARTHAKKCGLDWDALDDTRKIALAKRGVQGDSRQPKRDDIGDWAAWQRQIANLGWQPVSLLRLDAPVQPAERASRLEHAFRVASEIFDETLQRQAVVDEADLRVAAGTGLVASGLDEAADIDEILKFFSSRGALHDGKAVRLIWGNRTDAQGNEYMRKSVFDYSASLLLVSTKSPYRVIDVIEPKRCRNLFVDGLHKLPEPLCSGRRV